MLAITIILPFWQTASDKKPGDEAPRRLSIVSVIGQEILLSKKLLVTVASLPPGKFSCYEEQGCGPEAVDYVSFPVMLI